MAVYTKVTDKELSGFLDLYDVGEAKSFKGIAEGVENTNFFVETDNARFMLTLYEKRVDVRDLPFFLNLMAFLVEAGLPTAAPIADKQGKFLGKLNTRPAVLIQFLTGTSKDAPSIAQCSALGAILARLHIASQAFGQGRVNNMGIAEWRHIFLQCRHRMSEFLPDIEDILEAELNNLASLWPEDDQLPRGIIHADLFPDNILFSGDDITGIIDFYFSCTDFYTYDLAICLNAWCFDENHEFQATKARAMVAAYELHRPLLVQEKEALGILCRGGAIRFLMTRLYDWLHREAGALVTVKDPAEYLRKLEFHQTTDIRELL